MLKTIARRRDDDRGITIVMMALSLVALCAIGGMAIDGEAAYANRRRSQNAADSAALAGRNTIVLNDIRTGDQTDSGAATSSTLTRSGTARTHTGELSGFDVGFPSELPGGPWYLIHDDNGSGADNGSDADNGLVRGGGGTGVPGCGIGGSGFKGLVNTNLSYTLPGFWDSKTGQVRGRPKPCSEAPVAASKTSRPRRLLHRGADRRLRQRTGERR